MLNFKKSLTKSSSLSSTNGFTLIEILVSIVIISLIGIVFFPNLRKFNSDQQYRNQTQEIKSNIKSAQNMFQTGIKCTATEGATYWSLIISGSSNITNNLRANCITAAQVATVKNLTVTSMPDISILSSTCGATPTTIELRFDKNGFSYSCNSGAFTSGTLDIQFQNKKNTSQNTTITINKIGTISQN